MAKRTATRELNHDNWNDDEEEEEAGTFQQASSEALKGRVIKQARRRVTGNDGEAKKGFSGFAGFGAYTGSESNAFTNFAIKVPSSTETIKTEDGEKKPSSSLGNGDHEKEYLASLKVLNETVTTWITDHVKKNPCCVLTPIFQDYEKHLKDLEAKRTSAASNESKAAETTKTTTAFSVGKTDNEKNDQKLQFGPKSAEPSKPSFSFFSNGSTPAKSSSTFSFSSSTPETSSTPAFSFGIVKSDSGATTASSTFSFKPTSAASTTSPPSTAAPFSFSGSKPSAPAPAFSFGSTIKPAADEKKETEVDKGGEEEDDEDAPPKVEIKEVQEDDAFYSIRCKLFYKKDNSYTEKGVGTLHLKKVKDDKTQLVVRADTSLGNILLNIILSPQITTQRVGKNNVMLVCIPNPPIDAKTSPVPTPMLLRVKTDKEADELLAKLNEAKK